MDAIQKTYAVFSKLLQEKGVTAYRVYKETGVPQSSLSEWKRGNSMPKIDKMQKLAVYFNVPVEYLLTGATSGGYAKKTEEKLSIEEQANRIVSGLALKEGETLMLDGKPASPQAIEAFRSAVMVGIEMARKINLEKEEEK